MLYIYIYMHLKGCNRKVILYPPPPSKSIVIIPKWLLARTEKCYSPTPGAGLGDILEDLALPLVKFI